MWFLLLCLMKIRHFEPEFWQCNFYCVPPISQEGSVDHNSHIEKASCSTPHMQQRSYHRYLTCEVFVPFGKCMGHQDKHASRALASNFLFFQKVLGILWCEIWNYLPCTGGHRYGTCVSAVACPISIKDTAYSSWCKAIFIAYYYIVHYVQTQILVPIVHVNCSL